MAGRRGLGGVRVVHEDLDIFVVDKPSGLLTIGTDREKNRTLQAKLGAHVRAGKSRARVFIVHRLDRDASGLLVFARNP
jgi:23S rRNA-/tRNA-specific pseudouridylate synthase